MSKEINDVFNKIALTFTNAKLVSGDLMQGNVCYKLSLNEIHCELSVKSKLILVDRRIYQSIQVSLNGFVDGGQVNLFYGAVSQKEETQNLLNLLDALDKNDDAEKRQQIRYLASKVGIFD